MRAVARRFTPLLWLSTILACVEAPGEAGTAVVGVDCDPNDAHCAEDGLYAPIARGASVLVDASAYSGGEDLELRSVNGDVLGVVASRVLALAPGYSALLFVSPSDADRIVDFINVEVREADRIVAARVGEDGSPREIQGNISLYAGQEVLVVLEPHHRAHALAGDVAGVWTVDEVPASDVDSSVLDILETGVLTERRLVATHPGRANIEVAALGLTVSFQVEVIR